MITIVITVKGQDPVIDQDYYRHGIEINKSLEAVEKERTIAAKNALEPAILARNHAATGVSKQK